MTKYPTQESETGNYRGVMNWFGKRFGRPAALTGIATVAPALAVGALVPEHVHASEVRAEEGKSFHGYTIAPEAEWLVANTFEKVRGTTRVYRGKHVNPRLRVSGYESNVKFGNPPSLGRYEEDPWARAILEFLDTREPKNVITRDEALEGGKKVNAAVHSTTRGEGDHVSTERVMEALGIQSE